MNQQKHCERLVDRLLSSQSMVDTRPSGGWIWRDSLRPMDSSTTLCGPMHGDIEIG
ncbi:MAG: hypothetical protein U0930_07455 [Pirellulales bacterium]